MSVILVVDGKADLTDDDSRCHLDSACCRRSSHRRSSTRSTARSAEGDADRFWGLGLGEPLTGSVLITGEELVIFSITLWIRASLRRR